MAAANRMFARSGRGAVTALLILATTLGYAADVGIGYRKQSGRSAAARLAINIIVVPIMQTPQPAQPQSKRGAVAYNLQNLPPSGVHTRTSEKAFNPDSRRPAVLETFTIVPD